MTSTSTSTMDCREGKKKVISMPARWLITDGSNRCSLLIVCACASDLLIDCLYIGVLSQACGATAFRLYTVPHHTLIQFVAITKTSSLPILSLYFCICVQWPMLSVLSSLPMALSWDSVCFLRRVEKREEGVCHVPQLQLTYLVGVVAPLD